MNTTSSDFIGLAPLLRQSLAGNLATAAQDLLDLTEQFPDNANCWLNLSLAFLSLGQQTMGLEIQRQALTMQRVYTLSAAKQPARLRLLLLVCAGNLAANTPIDCLLEDSDIELMYYFVPSTPPFIGSIPDHDVLMVAIGESPESRATLQSLEPLLVDWPRPVLNRPSNILLTERQTAAALLQGIKGLVMPLAYRLARSELQKIADGTTPIDSVLEDCDFPIIVRPTGSHAGHGLSKLQEQQALAAYLQNSRDAYFYVSRFIDYSGADGLYRKYRIALIDGKAYACHMAVSSHWMVHYVNADMYQDADKRAEEADFMALFSEFSDKHSDALSETYQRSRLDYLCIDCAETRDGELLVFEIDPAMVVHAMDPLPMFDYKQAPILQVKQAFRYFLLRLAEQQEISA